MLFTLSFVFLSSFFLLSSFISLSACFNSRSLFYHPAFPLLFLGLNGALRGCSPRMFLLRLTQQVSGLKALPVTVPNTSGVGGSEPEICEELVAHHADNLAKDEPCCDVPFATPLGGVRFFLDRVLYCSHDRVRNVVASFRLQKRLHSLLNTHSICSGWRMWWLMMCWMSSNSWP